MHGFTTRSTGNLSTTLVIAMALGCGGSDGPTSMDDTAGEDTTGADGTTGADVTGDGDGDGPVDDTPPTVEILAPAADADVAGSVDVDVEAMDDVAVDRVELTLDGEPLGEATAGTLAWDTSTVSDGPHTLQAAAYDGAGNRGDSDPVEVFVLNGECTRDQFLGTPFGGGTGVAGDPYLICSVPQLRAVEDEPAAEFLLGADLDLAGEDWETVDLAIGGVFDGAEHSIRGLTITAAAGLFGRISGELRNLHVLDANVMNTGTGGGAGIVASNIDGVARNVHATGNVEGNVVAGGIAAFCSGQILGCTAMVDASAEYAGGLCGDETGLDRIEDSFASGTIVGEIAAGGLVSTADFGATKFILRSASSGTISSDGYAGGLVGLADGVDIEDCYSTATVSTTSDLLPRVAGLAGYTGPGNVRRSYFAGTIDVQLASGNFGSFVGGLVIGSPSSIEASFVAASITTNGTNRAAVGGSAGSLTDVYYDLTLTENADCLSAGSDPGCTGVNAGDAMPDYWSDAANPPMSGWDFTTVWSDAGGGFPQLRSLE